MSTPELNTARSLIEQKRYDEARALLKTIKHPTATKWLAWLDEKVPPTTPTQETRSLPTSPGDTSSILFLSVVSIIAVAVLTVVVIYQQKRISDLARADKAHASKIHSLASDLDSVSRVAENADYYAHSHGYSDTALKSDIVPIPDPLERLLSVRGVSFAWNYEAYPELYLETGRDYGVVAQELARVFPELVTPDPESGFLTVDYDGLIPVLIEAIREQQVQIDALQAVCAQPN